MRTPINYYPPSNKSFSLGVALLAASSELSAVHTLAGYGISEDRAIAVFAYYPPSAVRRSAPLMLEANEIRCPGALRFCAVLALREGRSAGHAGLTSSIISCGRCGPPGALYASITERPRIRPNSV